MERNSQYIQQMLSQFCQDLQDILTNLSTNMFKDLLNVIDKLEDENNILKLQLQQFQKVHTAKLRKRRQESLEYYRSLAKNVGYCCDDITDIDEID